MADTSLQAAFRDAWTRYKEGVVGTPLQTSYREQWETTSVVAASTFWGEPIDVVLPELVSCELHHYGLIEPGLTALFIDRVAAGSVVFDVGAHLGYYSLLAADLDAEVHAFEPSGETLSLLRKNVGEKAHVVSKGAWSKETTLQLKDYGSAHSAINTFVSPRDENLEDPNAAYPVSVTTVDRYVAESGVVPHLIKIDAEGAELEVLNGAKQTLETARPLVTIEVGDTEAKLHSRASIEFAGSLGYRPFDLRVEGLRPHTIQKTYGYGNIALIPD